jgi:hypothetical protein
VLEAFPEAGMVTAQPAWGQDPEVDSATLAGIENNDTLIIEKGDFVPESYRIAQQYGRGIRGDERTKNHQKQQIETDICVIRGNAKAYVGAGHFQFLAPKSALTSLLPLEITNPVGADRQFDRRLNAAGYWRLTTTDYLVHHMGNSVPTAASNYDGLDWLDAAAYFQEYANYLPSKRNKVRQGNSLLRYVMHRMPTQKLLRMVNHWTYHLIDLSRS